MSYTPTATNQDRLNYWLSHQPMPGTIIQTINNLPADVTYDDSSDRPLLSLYAFVPNDRQILDSNQGWRLKPAGNKGGMFVIVAENSRDKVLSEAGYDIKNIIVYSVRVLRYSTNGRSLIVEIHEWENNGNQGS